MRRWVLAACLLTLALSETAHANVPTRFTVQGVLRDNSGALQSTMVTFVIRIWQSQNSMAPADLLFTYSPMPPDNMVLASNGLFTIAVTMGQTDVNAIASALGSASVTSLWLEVTANGFVYARQPLTEVMSAIFADALSPACAANTCVVDADIKSVSGTKVMGAVSNSQALGGVPASSWYPIMAKATISGGDGYQLANPSAAAIQYVMNGTGSTTPLEVAITPTTPHGFFVASLSGSLLTTPAGAATGVDIYDVTTATQSGPLGGAGSASGNTASSNFAGWVPLAITWAEAVNDAAPTLHKFRVQATTTPNVTQANVIADLTVVWYPQP